MKKYLIAIPIYVSIVNMSDGLPMKREVKYTAAANIRIEPEMKEDFLRLASKGIDVAEWRREVYRREIARLKKDGKL